LILVGIPSSSGEEPQTVLPDGWRGGEGNPQDDKDNCED